MTDELIKPIDGAAETAKLDEDTYKEFLDFVSNAMPLLERVATNASVVLHCKITATTILRSIADVMDNCTAMGEDFQSVLDKAIATIKTEMRDEQI